MTYNYNTDILDERLVALRAEYLKKDIPLIHDDSLKLLLAAVKIKKPKEILEIGTAVGLSGAAMLMAEKETKLTTLEKSDNFADIAAENFKTFGLLNRAEIVRGDALDALFKLDKKFDLIFLDGPKAQYKNYLERLVQLLNAGGVLIADNVLFRGYVSGKSQPPKEYRTLTDKIREFLELLKADKRLYTVVMDVGDGMSISVREAGV